MNSQIWKKKYKIHNRHGLLDLNAQIITNDVPGEVCFTTLDFKYAQRQFPVSTQTSSHCNYSILRGEATGTYRIKTGFCGLIVLPKGSQKDMDCTLQGMGGVICYLVDILVVTNVDVLDRNNLVEEKMKWIHTEGWARSLKQL